MGSFLKSRGQDFEIFNDLCNTVNLELIWRLTKPHGAKLEAKQMELCPPSVIRKPSIFRPSPSNSSSGPTRRGFKAPGRPGQGSVWVFPYE